MERWNPVGAAAVVVATTNVTRLLRTRRRKIKAEQLGFHNELKGLENREQRPNSSVINLHILNETRPTNVSSDLSGHWLLCPACLSPEGFAWVLENKWQNNNRLKQRGINGFSQKLEHFPSLQKKKIGSYYWTVRHHFNVFVALQPSRPFLGVRSGLLTWSSVLKRRMSLQASCSRQRCSSVLGWTTLGSESSSSSSGLNASAHTEEQTCAVHLRSTWTQALLGVITTNSADCGFLSKTALFLLQIQRIH